MKQNLINEVIQGMLPYLNNAQTEKLQEVLQHTLFNYTVSEDENKEAPAERNLVESFLAAKRIEGCSEKSLAKRASRTVARKERENRTMERTFFLSALNIFRAAERMR